MRAADIDMNGTEVAGVRLWVYRPAEHKTEHHDRDRVIFLGPKAQAAIRPWLTGDPAAYLFVPDSKRGGPAACTSRWTDTAKPSNGPASKPR